LERLNDSLKEYYTRHNQGVKYSLRKLALVNLIQNFVDRKDRVIDLGCGDGFISNCVAEYVKAVVGIDRVVNKMVMPSPKVYFTKCDIVKDEFTTKDIEVVLLLDVLEHIEEKDEEAFLDKVVSLFTKRLIVNIPVHQDKKQPFDRKVDIWKVMNHLSKSLRLIYFQEIYMSDNEIYQFMVFEK